MDSHMHTLTAHTINKSKIDTALYNGSKPWQRSIAAGGVQQRLCEVSVP